MKRRFWKIFAIVCSCVIVATILGCVFYVTQLKNSDAYVDFDTNKLNEVYTSLTILDCNGKPIEEPLYLNGYKQIPIDALHDYTYMAFVAVEDKRFFNHNGIDYRRIIGAALNNIKSGRYKEGASTISQQLIKNTHLNNSKTVRRKINELLLAKELEKRYSKKEILEMYLNTIYFGRSAFGIETAANVYFNKSASNLTVSESAALAGMVKAPNTYAPDKNAEKCRKRRDAVLRLMKEQNIIDDNTYTEALNNAIVYSPEIKSNEKTYVYQVMNEACKLLNMTPLQLAKSNFVIETYCSQSAQKALKDLATADSTTTVKGTAANLACMLCDNKGGVEACYFRGENSLSKRQAGSSLKPIAVYAPALNEKIITQASPILDEETDFSGYKPTNAKGYNGWTTIRNAVAQSLNVPAVKTLNALGLTTAQKYLENFDICGEQNLSLALGNANGGIDPTTLAKCYTTLANDGCVNDIAYIRNIYNENGLIYERKLSEKRVFQSNANYLMTDLLINTTLNGTARKLKSSEYQIAAKTGTVGNSQGNSDAIVAGYTSSNTFVVWFSGEFSNSINGGTAPCTFAKDLLNKIYRNQKPQDFTQPNGIEKILLDKEQLYNNQLQVITTVKGESFLFEKSNKPKTFLKPESFNYTLNVESNDNLVTISVPNCTGEWILYSTKDGITTTLHITDNKFKEEIGTDVQYYAELYENGKLVYTTPSVKVYAIDKSQPSDEQEHKFPSIKDFWYW